MQQRYWQRRRAIEQVDVLAVKLSK